MDGFKVLGFHAIAGDAGMRVQAGSHVADQVLDKLGVVVGALGDVLFVRALEQAPQLAGTLFFDQALARFLSTLPGLERAG